MSTDLCVNLLKLDPATSHLNGWKELGVRHRAKYVDRVFQSGPTFVLVREIDNNFYVAGVASDRATLNANRPKGSVYPSGLIDPHTTPPLLLLARSADARWWMYDMAVRDLVPSAGVAAELKRALEAGLDPESTYNGQPLLSCVAGGLTPGHVQLVRLLVQAGANVNRTTECSTPLISAAFTRSAACIEALLELGAQPNLAVQDGRTALYLAAQRENETCVRLLLAAGANPDQPAADGSTPRSVGKRWAHLFVDHEAELLRSHTAESTLPARVPRM